MGVAVVWVCCRCWLGMDEGDFECPSCGGEGIATLEEKAAYMRQTREAVEKRVLPRDDPGAIPA